MVDSVAEAVFSEMAVCGLTAFAPEPPQLLSINATKSVNMPFVRRIARVNKADCLKDLVLMVGFFCFVDAELRIKSSPACFFPKRFFYDFGALGKQKAKNVLFLWILEGPHFCYLFVDNFREPESTEFDGFGNGKSSLYMVNNRSE